MEIDEEMTHPDVCINVAKLRELAREKNKSKKIFCFRWKNGKACRINSTFSDAEIIVK